MGLKKSPNGEDVGVVEGIASDLVSFSHVHMYVDKVEDVEVYKDLERRLNEFHQQTKDERRRHAGTSSSSPSSSPSPSLIEGERKMWGSLAAPQESAPSFVPQNRDVVKQLMTGFGFRVTGARMMMMKKEGVLTNTRSVLVTSRDPAGVQYVVTAVDGDHGDGETRDSFRHFDAGKVRHFMKVHGNRQGIAVLAFLVRDGIEDILNRYETLHPDLVADYQVYEDHGTGDATTTTATKVLEVYAYYKKHDDAKASRVADTGTVLRFLQTSAGRDGDERKTRRPCALPGLIPVEASFVVEDQDDVVTVSQPAYCDHWVSNVHSRTEFLSTLRDTLGFTPKVDFNAGVVAAGEAQIESTVTGNTSKSGARDRSEALRDQSQVYLPINNALSSVGHVHGFLDEIGQGVQHVASRVRDLVSFVHRCNRNRLVHDEGFTFLRIPRSYYGILSVEQLLKPTGTDDNDGAGGVGRECAEFIVGALLKENVLSKEGAVDLDMSREQIDAVLEREMKDSPLGEEYRENRTGVLNVIMRSRYKNLYSLLRHHLSEETYLGIVRNQILVDIQGEDLLYQIFTSSILQREAGQEAPFLEFIQRVCSECTDENGCPQKIRPGCGGFGIRNFLTLFLSIEVSKAMQQATDAKVAGDAEGEGHAQAMVDAFTRQLNESNPILTEIADAMTDEGRFQENMSSALARRDEEEAIKWKGMMEEASTRKQLGNKKLMECSSRYNDLMKSIRVKRQAAAAAAAS